MKMRTLAVAATLCVVGATAFAQDVKVDFDWDANFTIGYLLTLKYCGKKFRRSNIGSNTHRKPIVSLPS